MVSKKDKQKRAKYFDIEDHIFQCALFKHDDGFRYFWRVDKGVRATSPLTQPDVLNVLKDLLPEGYEIVRVH